MVDVKKQILTRSHYTFMNETVSNCLGINS